MKRCLYCYQPLEKNEIDFHLKCCKKIFNQSTPPEIPYKESDMDELAKKVIRNRITIPGVQPKISLDLSSASNNGQQKRFTIVGLMGGYI